MSKQTRPKKNQANSPDQLVARNVERVAELERSLRAKESTSDRIATAISHFCGSMIFVWVHVVFFSGWILLNTTFLPKAFDPFPFTFLTLVVSLEAIFLSTFIMIAENRQERISDRRSQLDLQINILAEQESTKTLQMLEAIARKLSVDIAGDPTIGVLEKATEPERLAKQIDQQNEADEKNGAK